MDTDYDSLSGFTDLIESKSGSSTQCDKKLELKSQRVDPGDQEENSV
jgi:hypothetical protein